MSNATLQERFRLALLEKNYVEIPTKTRKAVTLRNKHTGVQVFLGKCGSVRIGNSYSKSAPVSAARLKQLIETYNETGEV